MAESPRIGEDQLLFGNMDIIDVGPINNKTFADTDKLIALRTELVGDHALDLAELVRQHPHLAVGLNER